MNTNQLKRFAQDARRKLLTQVGAKLSFVLTTDSPELREKLSAVKQLRQELERISKEQLIEKVAYSWFNRLMAIRFMDANDYQPLGIRIITPKEGYTIPELLDEAKRGNISDELKINRQKVYDLLDGKIPSNNPQNEAYKELLIAACNHLHTTFPFLFEKISDYTELLLPDDLTSDFSIVRDVRDGMLIEDCQNVEIIGWLYQFYISEENERLIKGKMVYKKHEIAPASQLFTPKWIVKYMVDNTLGQLITELLLSTRLTDHLEYYIKPAYKEQLIPREKKRLEEIKLFDPCVGSGHILVYAFDVFYMAYNEQGYNESEIPELIIKHNLFGTDIDDRAAQLAGFALMMKGRQYYRRFLRKDIIPNIESYQDYETDNKFKNAKALGSLIQVEPIEADRFKVDESSIFGKQQSGLKKLYNLLGQRYDVVVTNPPYISSSRMEGTLKQYVEVNYPDTKSDLFATFVIRCLELCSEDGLTGYMTPFVWMFISSYEKLRNSIIDKHLINNLIQLEYSGFDGATVPICTFTLRNKPIVEGNGNYIRLSAFKGSENQAPKTLEAIRNPNCGWFYTANQKGFKKIPSIPIAYWLSERMLVLFESNKLQKYAYARTGLATGRNDYYLRFWSEINTNKISNSNSPKWYPYNKGGNFRKWYGNREYVINWENSGYELQNTLHPDGKRIWAHNFNLDNIFKNHIGWSDITSSGNSFRVYDNTFMFDSSGTAGFIIDDNWFNYIIGFLNCKYVGVISKLLNPTLHFTPGNFEALPFIENVDKKDYISNLVDSSIFISKVDWNSRETSWDFHKNELIRCKTNCGQNSSDLDMLDEEDLNEILRLKVIPNNSNLLEDCYQAYKTEWRRKFLHLHRNEEELNRQFIEIYGLQDELTPDVPLEEITILKEETSIENGELIFHADEVMTQFISYSVGCMFGRYSLDKEGLILANQGEDLTAYHEKVQADSAFIEKGEYPMQGAGRYKNITFYPDEDNIIPILEDEWFEDDIVARFYKFLKVTFGEENFNKNLAFLEEQIGKDIRKYFMKDFYADHIRRYKKRPIYWMFSSTKCSFNVLIYMHRYNPDTVSNILNKYLKAFIGKLHTRKEHLQHVQVSGNPAEINKAIKEIDSIEKMLLELREYERDILYPLATERIAIDLDDGVLVNYNKFGKALREVDGLNDKKTKEKVKNFDWIDSSKIK